MPESAAKKKIESTLGGKMSSFITQVFAKQNIDIPTEQAMAFEEEVKKMSIQAIEQLQDAENAIDNFASPENTKPEQALYQPPADQQPMPQKQARQPGHHRAEPSPVEQPALPETEQPVSIQPGQQQTPANSPQAQEQDKQRPAPESPQRPKTKQQQAGQQEDREQPEELPDENEEPKKEEGDDEEDEQEQEEDENEKQQDGEQDKTDLTQQKERQAKLKSKEGAKKEVPEARQQQVQPTMDPKQRSGLINMIQAQLTQIERDITAETLPFKDRIKGINSEKGKLWLQKGKILAGVGMTIYLAFFYIVFGLAIAIIGIPLILIVVGFGVMLFGMEMAHAGINAILNEVPEAKQKIQMIDLNIADKNIEIEEEQKKIQYIYKKHASKRQKLIMELNQLVK